MWSQGSFGTWELLLDHLFTSSSVFVIAFWFCPSTSLKLLFYISKRGATLSSWRAWLSRKVEDG